MKLGLPLLALLLAAPINGDAQNEVYQLHRVMLMHTSNLSLTSDNYGCISGGNPTIYACDGSRVGFNGYIESACASTRLKQTGGWAIRHELRVAGVIKARIHNTFGSDPLQGCVDFAPYEISFNQFDVVEVFYDEIGFASGTGGQNYELVAISTDPWPR